MNIVPDHKQGQNNVMTGIISGFITWVYSVIKALSLFR